MKFEWINEFDQNQISQIHRLMQNEWWCKNRTLDDVNKVIETSTIVVGAVTSSFVIADLIRNDGVSIRSKLFELNFVYQK